MLLALFGDCSIVPAWGPVAEGSAPNAAPPPSVVVVRVVPAPLRNVVDFLGQLVARESVIVKPEISGVIESVEFQEGQTVARDDVLFRLRREEQLARLRVAVAEASLAKEVYQRTEKLKKRDVSSAAQLDRAAAELEVARANVELARVNLARTEIRAPFDGVVGERYVSPGDRVSPGERNENVSGLVRLDSIEVLELVFTLPERALPLARTGIPVSLSVAPYPDASFSGEIFFVSPTFNPDTRRVLVKALVPNPDGRLRPGLFATIRAEIARRDDALVVPEAAVVQDIDGAFIWRLSPEHIAERVPIRIGLRRGGRVEILAGLTPGDTIVSVGTHKVSEGMEVRIAPPAVAADPVPGGVERAEVDAGGAGS